TNRDPLGGRFLINHVDSLGATIWLRIIRASYAEGPDHCTGCSPEIGATRLTVCRPQEVAAAAAGLFPSSPGRAVMAAHPKGVNHDQVHLGAHPPAVAGPGGYGGLVRRQAGRR